MGKDADVDCDNSEPEPNARKKSSNWLSQKINELHTPSDWVVTSDIRQ